jgi:cell division protein FtsQ
MARKSSSTILQEELYPSADELVRRVPGDALDDARLLDLDVEPEPPFLRAQKRVSVRRGSLPPKTATRLAWTALVALGVLLCGLAVAALYHYGERSWRFRVESSDDIEITGLGNVTRAQVMEVMGGDIGRNIFFVPLAERQKQLEQIPWVESASVMRFVPNRLQIEIQERTPVAFARVGSKIFLVDAAGTLMDLPVAGKKKYSFPVILGMNLAEPHSTRAARMKIYGDVISQLDSGGAHYSQDLSEVDLSDPEDAKVVVNHPAGEVLVHLGSSNYLERYKIFVAHVQEWRQQFNKLESVDLRYDRQIVVNPDLQGTARQPPLSFAAARAAVAAGVKPAALITHQVSGPKPPSAIPPLTAAKPAIAARRKSVRAGHRRAATKSKAKSAPVLATRSVAPLSPPAAQAASPKPSSPALSAAGTITVKPGNKPSPAIAKGEEHP